MDYYNIAKKVVPAIYSVIIEYMYKELNMNEAEIAKRLNITQAAVSKYINKKYSKAIEEERKRINADRLREITNKYKDKIDIAICTICQETMKFNCKISGVKI